MSVPPMSPKWASVIETVIFAGMWRVPVRIARSKAEHLRSYCEAFNSCGVEHCTFARNLGEINAMVSCVILRGHTK